MTPKISVQSDDFDPGTEIARLESDSAGAVASLCGNVRGGGEIAALELEHYPGMTEKALQALAADAVRRWSLTALAVIHRVGVLKAGAHIVFVGAAAPHREAALAAVHFLIDRLKTDAPFWKREHLSDGSTRWVEARATDGDARSRWDDVDPKAAMRK